MSDEWDLSDHPYLASARASVLRDVQRAVELLPPAVKKIDMFEPERVDRTVPLEETLGALQECVEKGWIGGVALSEATQRINGMLKELDPPESLHHVFAWTAAAYQQ